MTPGAMSWFAALVALVGLPPSVSARGAPAGRSLQSGAATLSLYTGTRGRLGVRVSLAGQNGFEQEAPLAIGIVDAGGTETWLSDGYTTAAVHGSALVCAGILQTPNGSRFQIMDTYRALPKLGGFAVARQVSIATPSASDRGFSSQFSLSPQGETSMADDDFFAPGVWYRQNEHVPPGALASHPADAYIYLREDRLPLPLLMTRARRTGATLSLTRVGGIPTTFTGEDGLERIIDARMQFGSLGIVNVERPSPTFLFPGTEGERTYARGRGRDGRGWAYRNHPVRVGVAHTYELLIRLTRTTDYPAAVRETWRAAYALANPPVTKADLTKVLTLRSQAMVRLMSKGFAIGQTSGS